MSQYPFPPPPYSPPVVDPTGWAYAGPNPAGRVAALLQFILGGLIFVGGTCIGTAVWIVPNNVLAQAMRQQPTSLPSLANYSPSQEIRLVFSILSGVALVAGGSLLLLAFFVRRGGRVSTICSIILNCMIVVFLLMNLLSGLFQLASNPMLIMPMLIFMGIVVLCITAILKLGAALESAGANQAMAMQQAYYWMMQQQQAAGNYGQGGYGYGQAAPPPANPPATPTAPQNPPPPPPGDAGQA